MSKDSETEDEPKFEVEKILDMKYNKETKRVEYYLKWIGPSNKACTWEPEENLDCPELLNKFIELLAPKKRVSNEESKKHKSPLLEDTVVETISSSIVTISSSSSSSSSTEDDDEVQIIDPFEGNNPSVSKKSSIISVATDSINDKPSSSRVEETRTPEEDNLKYEPEEIIGVSSEKSGRLMYLMKWKDRDDADLVHDETAEKLCPQIVIKFYKQRLVLSDPDIPGAEADSE